MSSNLKIVTSNQTVGLAGGVVQFIEVLPALLLSEAEALARYDNPRPFISISEMKEPYRSHHMAIIRLKAFFEAEWIHPPLCVHSPVGNGLIWRWWPSQVGIQLFVEQGKNLVYAQRITFINDPDLIAQVEPDFTRVVVNPPAW